MRHFDTTTEEDDSQSIVKVNSDTLTIDGLSNANSVETLDADARRYYRSQPDIEAARPSTHPYAAGTAH